MQSVTLDQIDECLRQLPPEKLTVVYDFVSYLLEREQTLSQKSDHQLIHGEFHGPRLSCEEDFQEAEWHLQDEDSDGR